jgi:DNA helicase IV
VDEAQELSLDDLLLLDTVLPHHSMVTLCGDLYQRQNEFGLKRWESVTKSMRGAIDIQSLKVNYRSTYEINTVGRAFMPAAESSPSPNRGKQPVAVDLREIGRVKATERVAELVQKASVDSSNQDRIGVIWMSAQAPINVPSLGKMADLASQRNERTDARIIGGPVADLGGLEYDHAIILIDDIPDTRESRRQLYVAVTRARRELTLVFCKGTPNWVVDVLPARVKVVG